MVYWSTGFNGRICGFTNGTQLKYFFEYSKNCTLGTNVIKTPSVPITATGNCNQTVPTANVTDLEPGTYCYRYVVSKYLALTVSSF